MTQYRFFDRPDRRGSKAGTVEFEIIPVDDNSPYKTWRLIQEIAKEKSRLIDSGKDLVAHDYAKRIHIPNSKLLSQR
jgi:hypothetical protein